MTKPAASNRRSYTNLLVRAFALSVVAAALFATGHQTLAYIAVACTVGFAFRGVGTALYEAKLDFAEEQFSASDIADPLALEAPKLTNEQVVYLCESIVIPKRVFSRIREKVSPATRALEYDLLSTLKLPATSNTLVTYVPLIVSKKGTMIDDLQVFLDNGQRAPVLVYPDYIAIVHETLRRLVGAIGPAKLKTYQDEIEKDLVGLIASQTPVDTGQILQAGAVTGRLQELVGDYPEGQLAFTFATQLIYHYAIVVQVPPHGHKAKEFWTTLSWSERKILPLRTVPIAATHRWTIEHVRKLFGVRPNRFEIPIERAKLAASYHLEFMGPTGTYLASQKLKNYAKSGKSYVRLRPRLGQRYAHLYARGNPEELRKVVLDVAFIERPPGSVGASAVSSLAAFALICVGAYLAQHPTTDQKSGGDLVAILLAFPGAVSAWVGLDRGNGPVGGTLSARLGAMITLVLSLTATAIYFGAAHIPRISDNIIIGPVHGQWALLAALAALNGFWTTFAWIKHATLYSRILGRTPPSSVGD
jgi:hypothetical protein